jgi:hypothetical protein
MGGREGAWEGRSASDGGELCHCAPLRSGDAGGGRGIAKFQPVQKLAQPLPTGVDGHEAAPAPAARAQENVDREHPPHQGRPGEASGPGRGRALGLWRRRASGRSTAEVGVPGRVRDHFGAQPGAGGQDAVEPEQGKPGRGDEHAEHFDQRQGIEQQVRRAVAAGVGQLVEELPPGALRQSLQRQRALRSASTAAAIRRTPGPMESSRSWPS